LLRQGSSTAEELSGLHHGSRADERRRIKNLGGVMVFDTVDKIWRVNGMLSVTRAIGDATLKPYVTASPEVRELVVAPGDLVVIASDGLWDEVEHHHVATFLRGSDGALAAPAGLQALVDSILDQGEDNITVMVVDIAKAAASLTGDSAAVEVVGAETAAVI